MKIDYKIYPPLGFLIPLTKFNQIAYDKTTRRLSTLGRVSPGARSTAISQRLLLTVSWAQLAEILGLEFLDGCWVVVIPS